VIAGARAFVLTLEMVTLKGSSSLRNTVAYSGHKFAMA
jgi:hypothetical protein